MWTSKEIRSAYLKFFESKGHLVGKSDSLVPDDNSLLYTSAGMVQFKPYFMGEVKPPCGRITTSQKCMRTDDIEEVGDAVHHTFFEMLGNFSFGDYFKAEVIPWAWEFLTEVLKLNPDHLWTSVYKDDDEAFDIWVNVNHFPKERIVRLDADKNYWPANAPLEGPNGVCGPCNEIFLDVTPEKGYPEDPAWSIAHDSNRFVEIWNLVFTQYDRQEDGTLLPLPFKNIDTGMGLERTTAVLNGFASNYDTDLFMPIINKISELSGKKYGDNIEDDKCFRVIADHIRSAVFAMCDGVLPENQGRGYVLRRLIRNAVVKGLKLDIKDNFMVDIIPVVVDMMGEFYPELVDRQAFAENVMSAEEERFRTTLSAGMDRFEDMTSDKIIDGEEAFTLYDTYGFPFEITCELAKEKGLEVDIEGFERCMEEQKERSKAASDFADVMGSSVDSCFSELETNGVPKTTFIGYEELVFNSTVLAIIKDKNLVDEIGKDVKAQVIVEFTPFYAEMGGQVGDTGTIESEGFKSVVTDTVKELDYFLHKVTVKEGSLKVGDTVTLKVNVDKRMDIERNHSATHLLHYALGQVLGDHVNQAGSLVNERRLRFDYTHFNALKSVELKQIEDIVNNAIFACIDVSTVVTDIEKARELGAKALFGEKYGDKVRVVKMRNSKEFCGGTHVANTGQLGMFKIISESSVGAGLRRIEAITGRNIVRYMNDMEAQINEVTNIIGAQKGALRDGAQRLMENYNVLEKQVEAMQQEQNLSGVNEIITRKININGINFCQAYLENISIDSIKEMADLVMDKIGSGFVLLSTISEDKKITFVTKATKDVIKKGIHCGQIVKEIAKMCQGGGGGRPDFAQAGGKFTTDDIFLKAMKKGEELIKNITNRE